MASPCEPKRGKYVCVPLCNIVHVYYVYLLCRCFQDPSHKDYEAVYDSFFVPYHPWGEQPQCSEPLYIPVSQLCHVTHKEEEKNIMRNPAKFHFMTNSKVGKSLEEWDIQHGCYCGESYRFHRGNLVTPNEHMLYKPIPAHGQVFPGFYTWWGLCPEIPPSGPQKGLPSYLKTPPNSIYGTRAFIISLHDVLESYASARSCSSLRNVCLRVGGTLRYKREIAYVIIVCTTSDDGELSHYVPIASRGEPIDMQGLIDDDGIVIDNTRIPLFTTTYHNTYNSYETLNFAFYFPEKCDFKCSSRVIHVKDIEHAGCIRKFQPKKYFDKKTKKTLYSKPKCPDTISDQEWKTHEIVTKYENKHL